MLKSGLCLVEVNRRLPHFVSSSMPNWVPVAVPIGSIQYHPYMELKAHKCCLLWSLKHIHIRLNVGCLEPQGYDVELDPQNPQ